MTPAIVKQPFNLTRSGDDLANLQRVANLLAASGYFQDAREMAQAAVKVMAGQELGIPPIASMMGISIIKGKVALGVHLIASRVRAHGYDFEITKHDGTGCTILFLGKLDADGNRGTLGESTFTEADARAAQVYSDMYKKYPRNMYYARAMSNGAKWYTPDVLAGIPVYTAEELGAKVDSEGDIVHDTSTAARQQVLDTKLAAVAQKQSEEADFTQEATELQPDLPGLIATMTDFKSCMAVLAEMKRQFVARLPESDYYTILADMGLKHSNDVKSIASAKKLLTALWAAWDGAKPAPDAQPSEVPANG